MKTRPCGTGFATAIPTWEEPGVIMWGRTSEDSTYLAAKEHIDLSHKAAELAREAEQQAVSEFRKIRARA